MYCQKCFYTSFDHMAACPKCNYDWKKERTQLNLTWIVTPGFSWINEYVASGGVSPVPVLIPSDMHEVGGMDFSELPTEHGAVIEEHPVKQSLSPFARAFKHTPEVRKEDSLDFELLPPAGVGKDEPAKVEPEPAGRMEEGEIFVAGLEDMLAGHGPDLSTDDLVLDLPEDLEPTIEPEKARKAAQAQIEADIDLTLDIPELEDDTGLSPDHLPGKPASAEVGALDADTGISLELPEELPKPLSPAKPPVSEQLRAATTYPQDDDELPDMDFNLLLEDLEETKDRKAGKGN